MSDSILLFNIINKFKLIIYDYFKLNIVYYPTLASLAFSIYKRNFLNKNNKIAINDYELYNQLKPALLGGLVDVYKPVMINKNKKIYNYDINSLYPYIMKTMDFPIGNPIYFEGVRDINSIFGIVFARIITPNELFIPILPYRGKNNLTLCPLGS
jgi:hypothetical protein